MKEEEKKVVENKRKLNGYYAYYQKKAREEPSDYERYTQLANSYRLAAKKLKVK